MQIHRDQITGLILAGGRGSRMGHVDKGLQSFRGEPMVAHVIRRLSPQVGSVTINANQNIDAYEHFGLPVWPDSLTGFEGPLAGVQTGLTECKTACKTAYMVTAPCDSPFLPENLVERLSAALTAHDAELAVAVTGEGAEKQSQPVFCLMKTSVLPSLSDYLQAGGRRIDTWHRSLKMVEVPFADEAAFRNINTLEELQRYETT
jgi:molybdopterin-guanine dinucleotide biosynthesis protein A